VGIEDAGRDEVERVPLALDDDRVPGVIAALVPNDHIHVLGEEIGDLAFSFVSPLRADQRYARHV
jgi:hypothetical protein